MFLLEQSLTKAQLADAGFHVRTRIGRFSSDMRFHVLGLGPIGQLVAFHLRRSLSPKHDISLMFKTAPLAKRARNLPLHIEFEGVVNSVSGFQTETSYNPRIQDTDETEEVTESGNDKLPASRQNGFVLPAHNVYNSGGELDQAEEAEDTPIESLFLACKAQSAYSAIRQIEHRLSPSSTIVLLQNGTLAVHEMLLQKVYPDAHSRPNFIIASNTHGAWLKHAPFHVVHAGIGQLRFGIVPNKKRDFEKSLHPQYISNNFYSKPRLQLDDIAQSSKDPEVARYRSLRNTVAVLQRLSGLGATWEPFADMQVLMRQKLVVNSVINPITAILGCHNGELFEREPGRRLAYRVCKEASLVFQKEAIANAKKGTSPSDVYVPPELSMKNLLLECENVAKVTASNTSSMLADLKKGNRFTEIEYLNGYLLTLGNRYGQPMVVTASLLDLVKLRTDIPLDTMV